ncbi:MAG: G5 domain-containing protein [Candidatus Saccharibacteria bacterium]|nr:G5 domain-containing protein [Candidatus Saccharibacteria bacterium]
MRLTKKFDYALIILMLALTSLVFLETVYNPPIKTFAEGEESAVTTIKESVYATIYDGGSRTIVKTTPGKTVREILDKMSIKLEATDIVEPGLDSIIDSDNYYINVYRSYPAVVKDGNIEKYIMTASFDPKTIAKDAGIVVYDGDEITALTDNRFMEIGVAPVYQITRHGGLTVTVEEEIPFTETKVKNYDMAPGEMLLKQPGELGTRELIYKVFYVDGVEVSRELISERVVKEPVEKIVAVGASKIEQKPLTMAMGRNYYTVTRPDGTTIERQETFYDLNMSGVMGFCGGGGYSIREDGVKIDQDGYVIVAADLSRYPRCSIVETSLGLGKVYDTGTFVAKNPEQFDIATDWTNRNGN